VCFEVKASIPSPSSAEEGDSIGQEIASNSSQVSDPLGKWITANPLVYNELKEFAREMRKNPTKTESLMWEELRNDKLSVNFRRQHIIGNFIPDFVCLENKLIVEIDGSVHDVPDNMLKTIFLMYLRRLVVKLKKPPSLTLPPRRKETKA